MKKLKNKKDSALLFSPKYFMMEKVEKIRRAQDVQDCKG